MVDSVDEQVALRPTQPSHLSRPPFRTPQYEVRVVARLLSRPAFWALIVLTLLGATAAFQVRHGYAIDVGSPADQAYMHNFHDRRTDSVDGRSFRWSDVYGYVSLPGVGGGVPFTVTLTLNPARP